MELSQNGSQFVHGRCSLDMNRLLVSHEPPSIDTRSHHSVRCSLTLGNEKSVQQSLKSDTAYVAVQEASKSHLN